MKVSMLVPWRPDGGPRDRVFGWVMDHWSQLPVELEVCLGDDGSEPFNRGAARNHAFALATSDLLLVVDADTIANLDGTVAALLHAHEEDGWRLAYDVYWNLDEAATEAVLASPPGRQGFEEPASFDHRLTDSVSGVIAITRRAWETVGGYDERFGRRGWGWEDRAFQDALDTLVAPHVRVPGPAWHLWHPAPHDTTFGSPSARERQMLAQRYVRARGQRTEMARVVEEARACRS